MLLRRLVLILGWQELPDDETTSCTLSLTALKETSLPPPPQMKDVEAGPLLSVDKLSLPGFVRVCYHPENL